MNRRLRRWSLRAAFLLLVTFYLGVSGFRVERVKAFERDLHFDVTFALALADSWTWDEALLIASADQAADENADTEPSLKLGEISSGLSGNDYLLHCFSHKPDTPGNRNADVISNLKKLEGRASEAIAKANAPGHTKGDETRALIAIGVYLHCQEDSWSHSGYGGTTFGHAGENIKKKTPDNPAERPQQTQQALCEKVTMLSVFMSQFHNRASDVICSDLSDLIKAITDPELNSLTMKLFPEYRKACNRALAEHWVYEVLKRAGKLSDPKKNPIKAGSITLPKGGLLQSGTACEEIYRRAFPEDPNGQVDNPSVTGMHFPDPPRYPPLDADGTPSPGSVHDDGTFDDVKSLAKTSLGLVHGAAITRPLGAGCAISISFDLANSGPSQSEQVAVDAFWAGVVAKSAGVLDYDMQRSARPQRLAVSHLAPGVSRQLEIQLSSNGPCPETSLAVVQIGPLPGGAWADDSAVDDELIVDAIPVTRRALVPGIVAESGVENPPPAPIPVPFPDRRAPLLRTLGCPSAAKVNQPVACQSDGAPGDANSPITLLEWHAPGEAPDTVSDSVAFVTTFAEPGVKQISLKACSGVACTTLSQSLAVTAESPSGIQPLTGSGTFTISEQSGQCDGLTIAEILQLSLSLAPAATSVAIPGHYNTTTKVLAWETASGFSLFYERPGNQRCIARYSYNIQLN